jgi:hypothetical protein
VLSTAAADTSDAEAVDALRRDDPAERKLLDRRLSPLPVEALEPRTGRYANRSIAVN